MSGRAGWPYRSEKERQEALYHGHHNDPGFAPDPEEPYEPISSRIARRDPSLPATLRRWEHDR